MSILFPIFIIVIVSIMVGGLEGKRWNNLVSYHLCCLVFVFCSWNLSCLKAGRRRGITCVCFFSLPLLAPLIVRRIAVDCGFLSFLQLGSALALRLLYPCLGAVQIACLLW
ncbi:hypothetical protein BKA64DRAFT_412064 [Cadophora sp. MPI-SDFR-AT-0126]|nr:hypothetical protein BKA64DRAFT_412064 [Leotiomycetes sp. MPI-SDFR-AT-0126]